MTNRKHLVIKEKWIRRIGIPLMGFTLPLFIRSKESEAYIDSYFVFAMVCTLFALFFWQGNFMITEYLRRKFPNYSNTLKRITTQLFFCFLYSSIISFALTLTVFWALEAPISLDSLLHNFNRGFSITIFVAAIYESVYFFEQWKKTIIESEGLKRVNMQSQFETLKNQVNPHFLFNSLNTLMSLIPENAGLAEEFTQRLSDVYRYVLNHQNKELVSLQTEMSFVEDYIFLQQIRFGSNLGFKMNIGEDFKLFLVAPLAIQMLIENAIKHNIVSSSRPLIVEIFIGSGHTLVIRNNLQKKDLAEGSTKIGLQNIIERYKYLTNKAVEVEVSKHHFTVSLPILKIAAQGVLA
jgi:two-component system, LytTR family, sensor kinase